MRLRLLVASSLFSIAACGGSVGDDASSVQTGPNAPPSPPALSCAGEANLTRVAVDCRPATTAVVSDGTWAYWIRSGPGYGAATQIVRASLAGGEVVILVSGAEAQAIAVDATSVYWTERSLIEGSAAIRKVPKEGGSAITVVARSIDTLRADVLDPDTKGHTFSATFDDAHNLIVDDEAIYWLGNASADFTVHDQSWGERGRHLMRAAKDGSSVTLLSRALVMPWGLAGSSSSVYWIGDDTRGPATLRHADKRLGTKEGDVVAAGETFRIGQDRPVAALAADESNVYFLSTHDGTVVKIPMGSTEPVVLASDQRDFVSIAVGGGQVYWTWSKTSDGKSGGTARVPVDGGPLSPLSSEVTGGIAYDASGLFVTADDLTRLTTCH